MENKEYTQNKIKGMIEDNKLDLSFMGLTEVPRAVFMFPRISQLDLSGNRISLLPQKINSLTNLVKLDISNNKLHELPDEIGKLSKLETLDVFKNEIEDLPLTFTNLKALKYLNITENPLNDKLAKVVGDSNKPNFQKAAVPKVMEYVMGKIQEKNKQIKKQEAVREKVKKINENEKKKKKSPKVEKNENNNIVKEMKEGSKSNGVHKDHNQTKSSNKANGHNKTKNESPKKMSVAPRRSFFGRSLRFLFSIVYYGALITLGAATCSILLNCSDGAKNIPGSAPLCRDLVKISSFEKPSPMFYNNVKRTYSTVLTGYKRKIEMYASPVTKKVNQQWRQFKKTEMGSSVEKTLFKIHAWIVEKYLLVVSWYNKEGHKRFGGIVDSITVGVKIAIEILKDVTNHIFDAVMYVFSRIERFVHIWLNKGFEAAMKTLN